MTANRIQIKASLNDESIVVPIGQIFAEAGREQLINLYEKTELQDNINLILDYETTRYAHSGVIPVPPPPVFQDYTSYYEFYFQSAGTMMNSFIPQGFSNPELAKNKKSFTRSFFKLDFYDKPYRKEQKLMFSIIIMGTQCKRVSIPINIDEDKIAYLMQSTAGIFPPMYDVYQPTLNLSPRVGQNEAFYIQWLKRKEIYDSTTFYMSCKFFNGKSGDSVRMVNKNPLDPVNNWDMNTYDYPEWFYYEVTLNVPNTTNNPKYNYTIRECNNATLSIGLPGQQAATAGNPIRFFEYITP